MKNLRLQTVATYINKEDRLGDVGCDHGYLAIMALEKGVEFVQLIDNKEGPLASAKQNLVIYENGKNIKYSLSSGISDLDPLVNTVAICGMGGELISKILEDDFLTACKVNKFILQPNSKVSFLRRYLNNNKFCIIDEDIVEDASKVYEIIVAKYDDTFHKYSEKEILFGPVLMKKKHPLFINKWKNKLALNKTILNSLSKDDIKYQIIENSIKIIEEVLYEN